MVAGKIREDGARGKMHIAKMAPWGGNHRAKIVLDARVESAKMVAGAHVGIELAKMAHMQKPTYANAAPDR